MLVGAVGLELEVVLVVMIHLRGIAAVVGGAADGDSRCVRDRILRQMRAHPFEFGVHLAMRAENLAVAQLQCVL